jgi:DNA helicase II / ATP-dependent DNA helicase PcrA
VTLDSKQLDLEDERAAQKRYRRKVQERARQPIIHQGSRNNFWTGTGLPRSSAMPYGALIGRVALRQPDEELLGGHSDFYIGETYADLDGTYVFSWAAPIASTFFRGSQHHELCDQVAVIRVFEHRGDDIVDFYDEPVCDDVPKQPFRKRTLKIPAPPDRAATLRLPPRGVPAQPELSSSPSPSPLTAPDATARPVRAEALLRAWLAAPRTKSLAPVLATLQPDQYDLVTVPAMDSMIIEGHPGTGKTIIASHWAAYLVNDETPPENSLDGDVLLVGPTTGYSRHVRTVIDRLTSGSKRVRVLSLPGLMRNLLGLRHKIRGTISRSWQDVDANLAVFVRAAVTRLKATRTALTVDTVYNYLQNNGSDEHPLTQDPEWITYLRRLPPVQDALFTRAHAPLLATIKWEVAKPRDFTGIEHIIVDEAQDVTPLEWLLLASMNEAHAWTIIR